MIINWKAICLLTGVQREAVQNVVIGTRIGRKFILEGLDLLIQEFEPCFGLRIERRKILVFLAERWRTHMIAMRSFLLF